MNFGTIGILFEALTASRFVFDNYTWDRDGPDYSRFGNKVVPARIPLSALISGKATFSLHVFFEDSHKTSRTYRWWSFSQR